MEIVNRIVFFSHIFISNQLENLGRFNIEIFMKIQKFDKKLK